MVKYHLIFDVSNMFHRSYGVYNYSIPNFSLTNAEHKKMLIRKFVVDICSIAKKIDTENIYLCFDHKERFRNSVDSNYKGNRTPREKEFYDTLDKIYDLFKFKNLNVFKIEGLEADDCIALTCERLKSFPKIIISADDDLKQLIAPRCYVLTPHTKNRTLYKSLYSVHPPAIENTKIETYYPQYIIAEKILKGCDGDNVPRLVKKGFRTENIKKFANQYMIYKSNHGDSEFDSIKKASAVFDLGLTDEQINTQLSLVRLQSQFMPEELVEKFNSIGIKTNRQIDFEAESILSNTAYWDGDYKKK